MTDPITTPQQMLEAAKKAVWDAFNRSAQPRACVEAIEALTARIPPIQPTDDIDAAVKRICERARWTIGGGHGHAIRAELLAAEKAELLDALTRARGNLAHVARILGKLRCQRVNACRDCDRSCRLDVSRTSVYRLLARHGVTR